MTATAQQLQAENELLLLQLHQVQEELEHYYLAYESHQTIGTSIQGIPYPSITAYPNRKPPFSPSLMERMDRGQMNFAKRNMAANTEAQQKHRAYLEQLRQNQELQNKLQEQEHALRARKEKLQENRALSEQFASQNNQYREKIGALSAERDALQSELGQLLENTSDLVGQKAVLETEIREISEKLNVAKSMIDQFKNQENRLEAENQTLATETQKLRSQMIDLQQNIQQASTFNKHSEKLLEELRSELSEKDRETRLGQKMLAKAQVDLDQLREQYANKLQSEQELVDLVKELRTKLEVASRYYFQIQQQHPHLLNSADDQKGK